MLINAMKPLGCLFRQCTSRSWDWIWGVFYRRFYWVIACLWKKQTSNNYHNDHHMPVNWIPPSNYYIKGLTSWHVLLRLWHGFVIISNFLCDEITRSRLVVKLWHGWTITSLDSHRRLALLKCSLSKHDFPYIYSTMFYRWISRIDYHYWFYPN